MSVDAGSSCTAPLSSSSSVSSLCKDIPLEVISSSSIKELVSSFSVGIKFSLLRDCVSEYPNGLQLSLSTVFTVVSEDISKFSFSISVLFVLISSALIGTVVNNRQVANIIERVFSIQCLFFVTVLRHFSVCAILSLFNFLIKFFCSLKHKQMS